ncbi:hypothetical protein BC941DRAFT_408666 [Chlamydoabsidia padenii]|nr:hypothetical protein BC941DRAFT_408666 [Chlamydoabsidia padenii]
MPCLSQKRRRSCKVFQCKGYGDCNMTFTRGEHLARHTRKHTGEKPFMCIIPNCTKAFSRFDNMMQHTQTHRRESELLEPNCYHPASPCAMDKVVLHQPNSMHYDPISPVVSSVDSMADSSCSSSEEEEEEENETLQTHTYFDLKVHDSWMAGHRRRLSVADLCNPMDQSPLKANQLTHDEVEALQAFGKLRQATW